MFRKLAPFAVVLVLAAVAIVGTLNNTGVETTTRTVSIPQSPVAHVPAIQCPEGQATMQCVLATLPAPLRTFNVQRGSLYGIDFAWGAPSVATMRSIGARFGASYLSYDPGKNWTLDRVRAFHAAGIATVAVWETTANRATQGYGAGVSDAQAASRMAAALGNTNDGIDFAVDCDCSIASITGYFQGVHHVLGNRGNAYGGYYQVLGLYRAHLVGNLNWQTYAWSRGLWLPASIAPLEQYLNGSSFDNDRAIAAVYGQWPTTTPPPPDPYAIYDKTRRHFYIKAPSPVWGASYTVIASEHNTVSAWDRAKCRNPVRRPVCKSSNYHLRLLEGRLDAVAHRGGHVNYRTFHRRQRRYGMDRRLHQR